MLGARASFKNMSVEALLDLELGKEEEKADDAAGDMNLRKQIRSVVMRYLELELKGKLVVFQVCGRLLVLGIQLNVFHDILNHIYFRTLSSNHCLVASCFTGSSNCCHDDSIITDSSILCFPFTF